MHGVLGHAGGQYTPIMHEVIEGNRDRIAELCRRCGVLRLEVFGSATGEDFDPCTSDVDFLVVFDFATGMSDAFDRYFDLKEGLEAILDRKVDLISENAIRNPVFADSVETSRTPLYAA